MINLDSFLLILTKVIQVLFFIVLGLTLSFFIELTYLYYIVFGFFTLFIIGVIVFLYMNIKDRKVRIKNKKGGF